MTLEDFVPPLDLCKRIPAGEFGDSALVWSYSDDGEVECALPRDIACFDHSGDEMWDAPTLVEIMAKLPAVYPNGNGALEILVNNGSNAANRYVIAYNQYCDNEFIECVEMESDNNPAAAALRLWLKLKGVE